MDLERFLEQVREMNERVADWQRNREGREELPPLPWPETVAMLDTALEELRVAEEELRQQAEELDLSREATEEEARRYLDLFDFALDGYLVTDMRGIIHEANRAAGSLLDAASALLVGKPLADFVALRDRQAFRIGLTRLGAIERRTDWEVSMQPPRGLPFAASLTVSPIRELGGEPSGLRWMVRDISTRHLAEEEVLL